MSSLLSGDFFDSTLSAFAMSIFTGAGSIVSNIAFFRSGFASGEAMSFSGAGSFAIYTDIPDMVRLSKFFGIQTFAITLRVTSTP